MPKEHTKLRISGIKCDNPNCDYRDNTVRLEDYKDWIDRPCPKCGDNLLTKENHEQTLAMIGAFDEINEIPEEEFDAECSKIFEENKEEILEYLKNQEAFQTEEGKLILEALIKDHRTPIKIEYDTHNGMKMKSVRLITKEEFEAE